MADKNARGLTDPRALRALAHPVRLALLEALRAGPLTATGAGELIDESPTTCSFHLRQLARYGFVAEVGGGRGRNRPWRLVDADWNAPARPDDPEFTRAAQVLDRVLLDRQFSRIRQFVDSVGSYPPDWQAAARGHTTLLHLTPAELTELLAAHREVAERFRERWGERTAHPDRRPDGTLPVEVLVGGYPVDPGTVAR